MPFGKRIHTVGLCAAVEESSSGRLVRVEVSLFDGEKEFAQLVERFAIRGRVSTSDPASPAPLQYDTEVDDTPRLL
ncbi:hypothetical protein QP363_13270, partial [Corynebacterium sp. UMB6689]|uniref:hypothetical protein n=1 Tax=Corynebacterium sp. UMB6689 TaxID=3046341 RepID=UPI0025510C17